MNILVIIPTLGYGGAERLLLTLLPKLKDKGMNIKVCTLSNPLDLALELEKVGISVVNLDLKHRWSVFEALIKLFREINKFKPNVIWGHLYFGILYSRFISIFFSQLKVVSVLHYNISTDQGLEYFVVHKDADVLHREQSEKLMLQLNEEEQVLAEEAALSTGHMLWNFLSGLCDKHDIKN